MKTWERRWWDIANTRRCRLILLKHKRGLSEDQRAELEFLQQIAEMVMEYDMQTSINRHLRTGSA